MPFDGGTETLLGKTEIVMAKISFSALQIIIRIIAEQTGFRQWRNWFAACTRLAGGTTMEPVVSLLPDDAAADCSSLFGAHKSLSLVDDAQPPSIVRLADIPTRIGAERILIKGALDPDVPDEQIPCRRRTSVFLPPDRTSRTAR